MSWQQGGQWGKGGAWQEEAPPSDRVFAANLPPGIDDAAVTALFLQWGAVQNVKVLPDKNPGQKRAAIVKMNTQDEAVWIVENLNGTTPDGCAEVLYAKYARPDTEAPPSENLFVGSLPPDMDEATLTTVFSQYGSVQSVKMIVDRNPGVPRAALVKLSSLDEATWVVDNLNGTIPQGLADVVQVRYAKPSASSSAAAPSAAMYVTGLPTGTDDAALTTLFGQYGTVETIRILTPKPGMDSVAAIVRLQSTEEATWVVNNVDGTVPQGLSQAIGVKYAAPSAWEKGSGKGWESAGGDKGSWGKSWDTGKGWNAGWDGGKGAAAGKGAARVSPYGSGAASWDSGAGSGSAWDSGAGSGSWAPAPAVGAGSWGAPNGDYGKGKGKDDGSKGGKGGKGKGGKEVSIHMIVDGLYASGCMPGGASHAHSDNCALFVAGLPPDTTDVELYQIFSPFGALAAKGVKPMMDQITGLCRGIGFVNFLETSSAETAIATLNGCQLPDGTVMKVAFKTPKEGKGKGKGKDGGDAWASPAAMW